MRSVLLMVFISLSLIGCKIKDNAYYEKHPVELEAFLKECVLSPSDDCERLKMLAIKMNELAFELQRDPQSVGRKILLLQDQLNQSNGGIEGTAYGRAASTEDYNEKKHELNQYLAVVQWLESPES